MPIYDYWCPECKEVREELILMPSDEKFCPICFSKMERQFPNKVNINWGTGFIGSVKPHDYGKHNKSVCYPGGKVRKRRYNELYEDGILGATR